MSNLKKILAASLAMVMTVSITACAPTSSDGDKVSSQGASSKAGDKKENTAGGNPVTITYGGWEGNLMMLELAERFNARNPDIKVEVLLNKGWMGNDAMSKLAATGDMPDIINLQDVVVPTQNKWMTDMKPYFDKDEENKKLPENFLEYGTVNDQLIMLPSAMFIYGVMVNKDLLQSNNIEVPGYDWTLDDLSKIAKATTKKGATIGLNEVAPLMQHIPAFMNPELGWGSFNETTKKYELGTEWEHSVNTVKDLTSANISVAPRIDGEGIPGDFEEGSQDRTDVEKAREAFVMDLIGETDPYAGWLKGKAAMWLDFSWAMGFGANENFAGFDWDYYPVPVVEKGMESRTPFVIDSIGITSKCANPEAAFEFVKYLSYSNEQVEDRMDIVNTHDMEALAVKYADVLTPDAFKGALAYSQMPVTTDTALIDEWAVFAKVKPGVKFMLENISTGYADGFKVTPGYDEAYSKTISKTVREQIFTGQKTAADLAKELETKANEITDAAYAALK